jgi:hypothetical protein
MQWEYCVVTDVLSGPLLITVTRYTRDGAQVTKHRAQSYDEGVTQLWPSIIAGLGREGWELVTVESGAWYFKRPINS